MSLAESVADLVLAKLESMESFPPSPLLFALFQLCEALAEPAHPTLCEALKVWFVAVVKRLPQGFTTTPQEFYAARDWNTPNTGPSVQLSDLIDIGDCVLSIQSHFEHDYHRLMDLDLCNNLRKQLRENDAAAHGLSLYQLRRTRVPDPSELNWKPERLIESFLKGTVFRDFFYTKLTFRIPTETQFAHTWVCAGSGHGKTTALTSMIFEHIPEVIAGKASIVLIDSQNVIIPALERLQVWQGTDRLIVIDPDDPVALSLFDVEKSSINSALEMINFVFAKLSESELTYRQSNLFDYLGEFLITAVPNATIFDFRNMLDLKRAKNYERFYPNASSEVQDYLTTDFVKEKFTVDARSQVLTKMRAMLRMPAFANMFGSARTKFNLFKELERGTCVLIKPSKYAMGDDGTRLFGRFWIAQMKMVAQQRQTTSRKTPTYFYIDECQDYLRGGDPKIETILEQARKERIGLTLLHHYGDQLKSNELLQLLGANTATKMCGSPASSDLSRFSSYMQCEPQFLLDQQPRKTFAIFVRGQTPRALSVKFPYIDLADEPRLTETEWRAMRSANRKRYGIDHPITEETRKQEGDTHREVPPSQPVKTGAHEATKTVSKEPENASIPEQSDNDLVINASKRLEALLVQKYGASGKGFGEKFKSVKDKIPEHLHDPASRIIKLRNRQVHQTDFKFYRHTRKRFIEYARVLVEFLSERPTLQRETPDDDHIRPARE